jgi:hypothetical protein
MGRRKGGQNAGYRQGGFRWSKKLNPAGMFPDLESKLQADARELLTRLAPRVVEIIFARLKRGMLAKGGRQEPIKPYSKQYARARTRAGLSTNPTLDLWGGLANHMSARVKQTPDGALLTIQPYGSSPRNEWRRLRDMIRQKQGKPLDERAGYWAKNKKTGYTWWVEPRKLTPEEMTEDWERKQKPRLTYQSIANQLAKRMGLGTWAEGSAHPGSFLTLTNAEREEIQKPITEASLKAMQAMLEKAFR